MRKITIMILSFLLLVSTMLLACKKEAVQEVRFCAEYLWYTTMPQLAEEADLIVWGEILEVTCKRLDQGIDATPHTVYTLKVEGNLKGNAEIGDSLEIKQLGGKLGNTHYIMEGYDESYIKKEHHYLFFLSTYSDSPASMINPVQGCYECKKDGEILLLGEKEKESGKIPFTLHELRGIILIPIALP